MPGLEDQEDSLETKISKFLKAAENHDTEKLLDVLFYVFFEEINKENNAELPFIKTNLKTILAAAKTDNKKQRSAILLKLLNQFNESQFNKDNEKFISFWDAVLSKLNNNLEQPNNKQASKPQEQESSKSSISSSDFVSNSTSPSRFRRANTNTEKNPETAFKAFYTVLKDINDVLNDEIVYRLGQLLNTFDKLQASGGTGLPIEKKKVAIAIEASFLKLKGAIAELTDPKNKSKCLEAIDAALECLNIKNVDASNENTFIEIINLLIQFADLKKVDSAELIERKKKINQKWSENLFSSSAKTDANKPVTENNPAVEVHADEKELKAIAERVQSKLKENFSPQAKSDQQNSANTQLNDILQETPEQQKKRIENKNAVKLLLSIDSKAKRFYGTANGKTEVTAENIAIARAVAASLQEDLIPRLNAYINKRQNRSILSANPLTDSGKNTDTNSRNNNINIAKNLRESLSKISDFKTAKEFADNLAKFNQKINEAIDSITDSNNPLKPILIAHFESRTYTLLAQMRDRFPSKKFKAAFKTAQNARLTRLNSGATRNLDAYIAERKSFMSGYALRDLFGNTYGTNKNNTREERIQAVNNIKSFLAECNKAHTPENYVQLIIQIGHEINGGVVKRSDKPVLPLAQNSKLRAQLSQLQKQLIDRLVLQAEYRNIKDRTGLDAQQSDPLAFDSKQIASILNATVDEGQRKVLLKQRRKIRQQEQQKLEQNSASEVEKSSQEKGEEITDDFFEDANASINATIAAIELRLNQGEKLTPLKLAEYRIALEKRFIAKDVKLKRYFYSLKEQIENQILGGKVAATGWFQINKEKLGNLSSWLSTAAGRIPDPAIKAALTVVCAAMEYKEGQNQGNRATALSSLVDVANIGPFADMLAHLYTMRYQQQIKLLDDKRNDSVQVFADSTAKRFTKAAMAIAQNSAKFEKVKDPTQAKINALIEMTGKIDAKHGLLGMLEKDLFLADSASRVLGDCTVEGIFERSGIYVIGEDGKPTFYSGEGCDPAKYGFTRGSKAEADSLHLQLIDESTEANLTEIITPITEAEKSLNEKGVIKELVDADKSPAAEQGAEAAKQPEPESAEEALRRVQEKNALLEQELKTRKAKEQAQAEKISELERKQEEQTKEIAELKQKQEEQFKSILDLLQPQQPTVGAAKNLATFGIFFNGDSQQANSAQPTEAKTATPPSEEDQAVESVGNIFTLKQTP